MPGRIILVVGPSGSGKGTLIGYAKALFPKLIFPKSTTTRAKRGGDSDMNYNFVTREEFNMLIQQGKFLEWAEYGGHFYGTPVDEVIPILSSGTVALKELEVQGARQVKEKIPKEQLVIVFVNAGTWSEMETRIRNRADMPEAELEKRRERYEDEIGFMKNADYVVENPAGRVEEAKKRFEEILRSLVEKR